MIEPHAGTARAKHVLEHVSIFEVLRRLDVRSLIDGQTQQIHCPIHEDRHPSARVYLDGHVHCWTCGKSWDAIGLVRAKFGYSFGQALAWLEHRFVVPDLLADDDAMLQRLRAHVPPNLDGLRAFVEARLTAARPRLSWVQYTKYWLAYDLAVHRFEEEHTLTAPQLKGVLLQVLGKVVEHERAPVPGI